jgi:hypothetical protein
VDGSVGMAALSAAEWSRTKGFWRLDAGDYITLNILLRNRQ